MQATTSGRQEEDTEKELENYCDYVDQFYIGRVISAADETFWMVKSLHQHSKKVFYISFGQSDLTLTSSPTAAHSLDQSLQIGVWITELTTILTLLILVLFS